MEDLNISKVIFNVKNIKRCLCPECPVQAESVCAEGKRRIMLEIAYSSESGMYFERYNVPGMYCSTGEALCKDLNPHKMCRCRECSVWQEYDLKEGEPKLYFCQNGESTLK
ncbi:MAG: DUF2769 domain-containing protein [Methanobacterium sp.]